MLHDTSGPTWQQTSYLPAAGAHLESAEVAIETLARFRSRGVFTLDQLSTQYGLHITHAGSGVLEVDGVGRRVVAGDVYAFLPGMRIHRHDDQQAGWRYTWVRLVGTRCADLLAAIGFSTGRWLRSDCSITAIEPLLDEIEAVYRGEAHSPWYPIAAAWRLIDRLAPQTDADPADQRLAVTLKRLLDEHYTGPVHIGDLARRLEVDRSTLYRRFQAVYGCSPKSYLDGIRLDQAATLLRSTTASIADIAHRCGFADAAHFGKMFKARHGLAPQRWRGCRPGY